MNIASFHNTYLGFTETFIYDQLQRISAYNLHVLARSTNNLERFPYPRLHMRSNQRISEKLWLYYKLLTLRPKLVHAHFGTSAVEVQPYLHLQRIPLVVSYYGFDVGYLLQPEASEAHRRYAKRIPEVFRHAKLHLALTSEMRDHLVGVGAPAERVKVHPLGVDVRRFQPTTRPRDRFHVLLCGREVEKKGFAYGFQALAKIQSEVPSLSIDFIGPKGPLRSSLETLAQELGIFEKIRFLPHDTNIASAMQDSDVILAPSVTAADGDREGLPTVLVEAAASGLPAVASRHAGIPDIVRHEQNGFLCKERDVDALATALRTLAQSYELRQQQGAAARQIAESNFDINQLVSRLEGYYREIIR